MVLVLVMLVMMLLLPECPKARAGVPVSSTFFFVFPAKCLRCTERQQQLLRLLLLLRQHRLLNKETLQLHVVSARFFHKFSTI
uniref:Putative secreted protein n=1 Tax=Anopheles darlingi TaxID=43151 RepID=A0A2M4DJT1_ANODA